MIMDLYLVVSGFRLTLKCISHLYLDPNMKMKSKAHQTVV